MNKKTKIKELLSQGEGLEIEFKESKNKLSNDVFETVCAFLNRNGGHLFLGVRNNGDVTGLTNPEKILDEFITQAHNPKKLYPTFYFSPEIIKLKDGEIIYIHSGKFTGP